MFSQETLCAVFLPVRDHGLKPRYDNVGALRFDTQLQGGYNHRFCPVQVAERHALADQLLGENR